MSAYREPRGFQDQMYELLKGFVLSGHFGTVVVIVAAVVHADFCYHTYGLFCNVFMLHGQG